jgi:hypothetical protein
MLRQQNEATTVVLDGRIYVMGGFTINSDEPIARVQIYDVAGDQWSLGTPLPEPVHHAGAALVGGKIYQIGGFHNAFGQRDPIDAVWAFDPATRQWERRAPLPSPRGAMVVAAIGDLIYAHSEWEAKCKQPRNGGNFRNRLRISDRTGGFADRCVTSPPRGGEDQIELP